MPSFDIQPSGKRPVRTSPPPVVRASAPISRIQPRPQAAQRSEPRPVVRVVAPTRKEAVRAPQPMRRVAPLKMRRRSKRKKVAGLAALMLLAFFIALVVLLWQPFLRIQRVSATGPGSDTLPIFVQQHLEGRRFVIFPRSSVFFVPTKEVRADILYEYPNIEAVSISSSGFTSLSISTIGRATAFVWCGTSYAGDHSTCFETDPQRKIFNQLTSSAASTTDFIVYGQYHSDAVASSSPLGATLDGAHFLPELLRFVKTLKALGASISSVEIRGDEADLYTAQGTRITYVLGREQQAASLAATAFPSLTLSDNSLLYVDLRFDSKVFFKKREVIPVGKK